MKRLTIQLTMAVLLTMSGIVLLFCGFWIDPRGEVDNSAVSYTHLTLPTTPYV